MRSLNTAARRAARPLVVLVAVLAALTASTLAYADGVDVSNWQGGIDWSKVKASGVEFAFMKATEGTSYSDPSFAANWAATQSLGIYHGAYHFAQPGTSSGAAQARYFVAHLAPQQVAGVLPPVLDLEVTGGLGSTALQAWTSDFLTTVETLTGRAPMIYTSPYFWIDNLGNSTAFHHYPLWVANYGVSAPMVPGGWPTYTFWQRTSSGSVSGIAGSVDMNRFNGTTAGLASMAYTSGGSGDPVPPGPTVPAAAPTTLTATPSTTTPAIDGAVSFTGSLMSQATPPVPVPLRQVVLQVRPVGSTTWSTAATAYTDATGAYRVSATVPRPADYRVFWVGGKRFVTSTSPTVRLTTPAPAATRMLLHPGTTTVRRGAALTLWGKLTTDGVTGVPGQVVRYYKRSPSGTTWIFVAKATTTGPSGYQSIVVHPLITRVWKSVYAGNERYVARTSPYVTVRPQ